VRGLRHIFRSLEHHVLEQMCEAGPAFAFIARAHVVIDRDRDYRHRMIFIQNYAESVVQAELFYRYRWNVKSSLHKMARSIRACGKLEERVGGLKKDSNAELSDKPRRATRHDAEVARRRFRFRRIVISSACFRPPCRAIRHATARFHRASARRVQTTVLAI
jgi:hypothetical protein